VTQEQSEKLRPFTFHGLELESVGNKRHKADCPFCGKESKFFVHEETGLWDCKSCQEKGNIPVFLQKLYEESKNNTKETDLAALAKDRQLPASIMLEWGIVKSAINGDYLIPAHNTKGTLANLHKVVKGKDGKWLILGTPGCNLHPFGTHLLNKTKQTVWVAEGPWDGIATDWALRQITDTKGKGYVKSDNPKTALHKTHGVMAIPGAGNFQPEWSQHLDSKTAMLCLDNDHPHVRCLKCKEKRTKATPKCQCGSKETMGQTLQAGWQGSKRACKVIGESGLLPKSLYRLKWGEDGFDPELKHGYDMRDLMIDGGPLKLVSTVMGRLEHVNLEEEAEASDETAPLAIEPLERTTYKALVKDYKETLCFSDPMRETLTVMLAVAISTDLKGDQLWLRVIGPPGSGKTTLAECMSVAREWVYAKSMFTGFHSGFTGGVGGAKKDASLIPVINGKTFVIKEGDNLLTAPNRDRILSELRDLYDGTSRSAYRNRVARDYEDVKTTIIVCGTDTLRGLNRSSLGDRFLDCEIFGEQEADPYLDRALNNTFDRVTSSLRDTPAGTEQLGEDKMLFLKRATYGYLKYMKENLRSLPIPKCPEKYHAQIKALGQFLGNVRARGHRSDHEQGYRPRAELATRLVSQFAKLAICIALVLGKEAIDDEVIALLRKVVIDTATSYHLEIVQLLYRIEQGTSKKAVAYELKLSEETIRLALTDMQKFNVVTRRAEPNKSGIRGRDLHLWCLSDSFRQLMELALGKPINSKRVQSKPRPKQPVRNPVRPSPVAAAGKPTAARKPTGKKPVSRTGHHGNGNRKKGKR
jgi:hypothetical protein